MVLTQGEEESKSETAGGGDVRLWPMSSSNMFYSLMTKM